MNSRVSWSVEGIDPSVRERAEAAARRAGMSLNDWLNSTIGDSAPPNFRSPPDQRPAMPEPGNPRRRRYPSAAGFHHPPDRTDFAAEAAQRRRRATNRPRSEQAVARQLNDAISRLDARLSQISNPPPARQAQAQDKQRQAEMVERAAAQVYRPSPPLSPASLDFAIAEIAARQNELDAPAPRQIPPRSAPPIAPAWRPRWRRPPTAPAAPPGPDFSALERHLFKITSQIEALQRPDGIEQSIAAFRSELTEIRHAITEAMPRRAIESIENEIRSLSRRIDDTRQTASTPRRWPASNGRLSEIREVLRSLTPAEQLAGYDEAIRNLGAKLDLILRANDDPSTVQQLEGAIAALRAIVSNVASNDALARLSDDVHTLSSKVDQLSRAPSSSSDSFAILEQRIAALTSTLESRERAGGRAKTPNSSKARCGRCPTASTACRSATTTPPPSPISSSACPICSNGWKPRPITAPRSTSDGSRTGCMTFCAIWKTRTRPSPRWRRAAAARPSPTDKGLIDLVKRELSDIRFSQTEAGRHTQDSLEAVHNTLGHVVDRLAMIEGDLRAVRTQPVAPPPEAAPAPQAAPPQAAAPHDALPPQPKPELPNPAAAQEHFAAAPRGIPGSRCRRYRPRPWWRRAPSAKFSSRIPSAHADRARPAARSPARTGHTADRPHRVAVGAHRGFGKRHQRNSGRQPRKSGEKVSTSSFIAAARRAAQAAAAAPTR